MKLLNKSEIITTRRKKYEYAVLSWRHIEKAVNIFKNEIKHNRIKFDKILVLVRGGMVPAVMLAHALDKRELAFLQGLKTGSNKPHDYCKFSVKMKPNIERNKKYLVVEDIIFEGDTTFSALQYIKDNQGKVSGVCSVVADETFFEQYNSKYPIVPLICVYQCEHLKWIRFPWEKKIKSEVQAI